MIKRTEIANMVLSAQQDGATHLFVARHPFDEERYYGVRVMPGQDPHKVHAQSDDWLVECYALQDPELPIRDQLAERRAWHMPPTPSERSSAGEERFVPELVALKSAVAEYTEARALAFSPQNQPPNYQRFEAARAALFEATRTTYKDGALSPFQIRRTTGYSRREVERRSASAAGPASDRSPGERLSPAAAEALRSAELGSAARPAAGAVQSPRARPWWSQPARAEQTAVAGLD